jgi:hypothetical protein
MVEQFLVVAVPLLVGAGLSLLVLAEAKVERVQKKQLKSRKEE